MWVLVRKNKNPPSKQKNKPSRLVENIQTERPIWC